MPPARIKTGVPGLDDLIEGGLIPGSSVLLAGHTGAGKTLFSLQFLWNGLQRGEPGVYISFEQTPEELKGDALVFGWNFEAYERKNLCKIAYYSPFEIADVNKIIIDDVKKIGAKRIVIDSTSVFAMYLKDEFKIREKLYSLIRKLKETKCTAIMTSEMLEDSKGFSRYGVEEFIADGVITLDYIGVNGEFERALAIRKMRRTGHYKDLVPFTITGEGIIIERGG